MITARNPRWADELNQKIILTVKFPWMDSEIDFVSSYDDAELHGREIYARALNGDFGNISPFVQPVIDQLTNKKRERANLVKSIVVTTSSGHSFDGNEDAQNRMARAIAGMNDADVMPWVLADNSIVHVGKVELREALRLSGMAQSVLWVAPYQ